MSYGGWDGGGGWDAGGKGMGKGGKGGGKDRTVLNPTNIVYFSVANPLYKVDAAMMHEVFSKMGTPQKLYIFAKDGHPQGFCELASVAEAMRAVEELHKKFLFDGGANQLTLKTTDRRSLNTKGNDEMNWEITSGYPPTKADDSTPPMPTGPPPPMGKGGKKGRPAGGGGYDAYQQSNSYEPYPTGKGGKGKGSKGGDTWGDRGAYSGYAVYGNEGRSNDRSATTPVVLFNGLPTLEDTSGKRVITTDSLFVLCGCYGDVLKVKFLKEPTQALVELSSVRQAETVRVHLDKLCLFGTHIRVYGATNDGVSKNKGQQLDQYDYWEYYYSKLHRFTNAKSYANIACPKPTLVVWGYPEGYPESELIPVFANYGTVESYKIGPVGSAGQMLLVQLENTDQATVCLLNLHDLPVTGPAGDKQSNLRINFAKENIHTPSEDNPQTFCNVMVKGLPIEFSTEDLYSLFAPYGNLKRHTIWKDKNTAVSRGFGLVEYTTIEEAKAAIAALNGSMVPNSPTPIIVTSKYV